MKPLYHGTIYEFDEIDVSVGKGYKDFGKGFYATAIPSHAEKLAIRNKIIAEKRQSFLKNKKGIKIQPIVAYRYNLIFSEETAGLKIKIFEKADKEWLRFILQNRKCDGCMHDYDIVKVLRRTLKQLQLSTNTMMNWKNQDILMKYATR